MIERQDLRASVHGLLFQQPWLSWFHETGLANFYQGLSPAEKPQAPTPASPALNPNSEIGVAASFPIRGFSCGAAKDGSPRREPWV